MTQVKSVCYFTSYTSKRYKVFILLHRKITKKRACTCGVFSRDAPAKRKHNILLESDSSYPNDCLNVYIPTLK